MIRSTAEWAQPFSRTEGVLHADWEDILQARAHKPRSRPELLNAAPSCLRDVLRRPGEWEARHHRFIDLKTVFVAVGTTLSRPHERDIPAEWNAGVAWCCQR